MEKPGEKALEAIKKLNSEVSLFKVPKTPIAKKKQMKILTEEHYIEELGKIIQKDFFPDLEKLKVQNQYLDAVEKSDMVKLRELYAKYSGKAPCERSRSESPATFETPLQKTPLLAGSDTPKSISLLFQRNSSSPGHSVTSSSNKSKAPSDGHSLDSFLSTYTSEDNNSFQELIESSDKKLRQKFSALFDAEKDTALAIENSLALPNIEDQFGAIERSKTVDTWKYKNKNYMMYIPDGVELTKEEQLEMAKQKQGIEYRNTRLMYNPFDEQQSKNAITELAKTHAKDLTGRIGVDGNSLAALANTPYIRGFSFVKTPSPHPGIAESPQMTWGELEGTPFRLDGGDTPLHPSTGPSFRIAETSRRENIALALAEKAGERMRDQKAKAIETARRNIASPHVRSSLDRLALMSPAAKRLASSQIRIRDSFLTPSPRRIQTPQAPSPLVRRRTPLRKSRPITPKDHNTKTILTDDLLNIPSKSRNRPKAADYF